MINIKEILRYLGYGNNEPDERVMALIIECIEEVEAVAEPKCIRRRFDLSITGDNIISFEGMSVQSRALAKNLENCKEAYFMAGTLGIGVDRLLAKNLKLNMTKAAVIQATAAAAIEDYCDMWQQEVREAVAKEGLKVKPRFSPGYGDLKLELQPVLLNFVDAGKKVGITLSEGGVMIPEKSVTAFMGLYKETE